RRHGSTAAARSKRRGHLVCEHVDEHSARRVSVEVSLFGLHGITRGLCSRNSQVCTQAYPVGPNRSVRTCDAACPSSTSSEATDSTSTVGPHTYACGPADGGQITDSSIARSIRRRYPVHVG